MTKDWIGNKQATFVQLGSSSHTEHEREANDYYATDPIAIDKLFDKLGGGYFSTQILEPACGEGHLSKRMWALGKQVESTDLIDRGFGSGGCDFLSGDVEKWHGDIITNPPYAFAEKFVRKGIEVVSDGSKVAMFLRIQFLESKARKKLFAEFPPRYVCVFSERVKCAINGKFEDTGSSAACYAWFVWEKSYKGVTEIIWI